LLRGKNSANIVRDLDFTFHLGHLQDVIPIKPGAEGWRILGFSPLMFKTSDTAASTMPVKTEPAAPSISTTQRPCRSFLCSSPYPFLQFRDFLNLLSLSAKTGFIFWALIWAF